MNHQTYIGRFAPSPTGPLHFGSMIAAVASYLQARAHHGKWLVRIEDVDVPRCIPGADKSILNTLENFGMHWDGEVVHQSQRSDIYAAALDTLKQLQQLYPCNCSRKQLSDETGSNTPVYPGTCRAVTTWPVQDFAVRLKTPDAVITFADAVHGLQQQNLARSVGDFVIRRRDGLFAYQLAVVVDDALQGVTEVVRGTDLLDSTPRQIYLQRLLSYAQPGYMHVPIAVTGNGNKLGKSTGAAAIDNTACVQTLLRILRFLHQPMTTELIDADIDTLWQHAITHWDVQAIPDDNAIEVICPNEFGPT